MVPVMHPTWERNKTNPSCHPWSWAQHAREGRLHSTGWVRLSPEALF